MPPLIDAYAAAAALLMIITRVARVIFGAAAFTPL